MMLFHISVALTLLALVAGMYLLAKTKAEGLGKFFNFVSWFIIIISGLMLVASIVHGCMRMCCRGGGMMIEKEYRMEGMGPMGHGMGGWREECKRMGCESDDEMECHRYMMDKEKMDCCKGMGKEDMEHCKGMMKDKDGDEKEGGMKKDSAKH